MKLEQGPCRAALLSCVLVCTARAAPALATPPAPSSAGESKTLDEMSLEELMTVRVSPFDVSTNLDDGYRASNSVSGSRFDAPIGNLPFAIQAFTESFIADQKPENIFDVARYAPGVTYRSNDFNEGNANLAIRGFAISSTPGNVQILRDGFHGPSIFDFTNIARVEVVKGPASFLYGQVAPGGIVNIITKTPQRVQAATAKASYGSYGEYRFESDLTGPAVEKRLFYRLAASYEEDMHYWKPYDAHSFNVSPSLLARPSDWLSVTLKFEHFGKIEEPQVMQKPGYRTQDGVVPTSSDPNRAGVDVPGLPDDWNSMSYGDFRRSDTNGFSAWADLQAGDHWNVRTGYSHQDYTVDALFTGSLGMANNSTFLQGRRVRQQTYTNWGNTIETQAVGKYEFKPMSVRLLVGAQYVSRRFDVVAGQAPNDPTLGDDPTASPLPLWDLRDPSTWNRSASVPLSSLTEGRNNRSSSFKDRAVYGGVTFGLFDDRLLVLAGWRQTWTDSQLTEREPQTWRATVEANQLTPQYGALYKLTSAFSLFSSYAESFVPGSQLLLVRNVPTTPAAPTRGHGFEAGVKFEPLAKRLSGTLTYFDIHNKNIVNDLARLDPATGVMLFTNVQSGEQRSQGIELDATLSLNAHWQAYASYSYMDARVVELLGNDAAILAQGPDGLDAAGSANYKNVRRFHGAPLQMSAPHLANIWSRYDFSDGSLAGLFLAGGVNLVYRQTLLSDTPASAYQTYALLGATLGYMERFRSFRVILDLTGKNLANQHYRPSQSSRSRPREFLLSCAIKL